MGCDIHPFAEHRKDGIWLPSDIWVKDNRYGNGYRVPWHCGLNRDRNYNWFAFLADVRNGTWGEVVPVLFEPRGIPTDCSKRVLEKYECDDGHSASYVTLGELEQGYNARKDDSIVFHGCLDPRNATPELAMWLATSEDKRGAPPHGFCASGGRSGNYIYPHFTWSQKLSELIGRPYQYWHDYLSYVGFEYSVPDRPQNIRVVFWFDN